MKKVYIPTEEELFSLQEFGGDIYYYLLTKTIESMIMVDVIYEEEDMFDVAYEELAEFPSILLKIATMYPDRISFSERASKDIALCTKLISTPIRQNIPMYGLDYLTEFSDEVLQSEEVMCQTITTLAEKLKQYPRYRFEYKGPNPALDSIFACEISKHQIYDDIFDDIISIDPIWLVKLKDVSCIDDYQKTTRKAIASYARTYGFTPYSLEESRQRIDYLTKPNDRVKKLIRCLNRHKQYYQY